MAVPIASRMAPARSSEEPAWVPAKRMKSAWEKIEAGGAPGAAAHEHGGRHQDETCGAHEQRHFPEIKASPVHGLLQLAEERGRERGDQVLGRKAEGRRKGIFELFAPDHIDRG